MALNIWKLFIIRELTHIFTQIWNNIKEKVRRSNNPDINSSCNSSTSKNTKTKSQYLTLIKVYPNGLMCPNCGHIEWNRDVKSYRLRSTKKDETNTKMRNNVMGG